MGNKEKYIDDRKHNIENKKYDDLPTELKIKFDEIDNLPYPKKPTYISTLLSDNTFVGMIIVAFVALSLAFLLRDAEILSTLLIGVFVGIIMLLVPVYLFYNMSDYKTSLELYDYKIKNWNQYKNVLKDNAIYFYENKNKTNNTNQPLKPVNKLSSKDSLSGIISAFMVMAIIILISFIVLAILKVLID